MKKLIVSLVAVAALGAPVAWSAGAGAEPDANGDLHSNCHTGSKFRGAGGNDKNDPTACAPAVTPVTPAPAPAPAAPAAPAAQVRAAPSVTG